jgi:transposase
VVDALGNPVRLALSPGQTHEMKLAYELLGDITDAYVAGDKAYDATPLIELLEGNRCTVVIPSKADRACQRKIDRHLYKERRLVEISHSSCTSCHTALNVLDDGRPHGLDEAA